MAKILVVDDNKDMCLALSDILKEDGYQVEIAQTGKFALIRIKAIEPDVVVLDYNLSGVSSIPILKEALCVFPSLKVIMISAYAPETAKAAAKKLGAHYFLDKPFDIKKFSKIIKKILAKDKVLEKKNTR
ncbi:MAG: response regulator [Candidatus Atribacteria bacterium]|nr:response regulator [Candidatus Atribacteria bacterium]